MSEWYERAFDASYLEAYEQFEEVAVWMQDCDFIAGALDLKQGQRVLDLCSGSGRHSVELANRGFSVTGLDISPSMIDFSRRRAKALGVKVDFVCADAREMEFDQEFDAAFNYLTSFGYCDDAGNQAVLDRVFRALKPGGRFMIEKINPIWLFGSFVKTERRVQGDFTYVEERSYDARTGRISVERVKEYPDGTTVALEPFSVRAYLPISLAQMLEAAGFEVEDFIDAPSGVDFDPFISRRMAILAQRPA